MTAIDDWMRTVCRSVTHPESDYKIPAHYLEVDVCITFQFVCVFDMLQDIGVVPIIKTKLEKLFTPRPKSPSLDAILVDFSHCGKHFAEEICQETLEILENIWYDFSLIGTGMHA